MITGIAVTGACVAAYHTAIQFHMIALPNFCTLPDAKTFDGFMAVPTATCSQWTMTFLSLPVPFYLIFFFVTLALVTHSTYKQRPKNY